MKRLLIILLTCIFLFSFTSALGGSGTLADPYTIANWSDLNATRNNLTAHYILLNDLSSASADYNGIGDNFSPIEAFFDGSFNGMGNSINDIIINKPSSANVGLFSETSISAIIQNLSMYNASVIGTSNVGILIGKRNYGNVYNVHVDGSVKGSSYRVGGMIGGGTIKSSAILENLSSSGIVNSTGEITGGLVGGLISSIKNSHSNATVYGTTTVGGLIGNHDSGNDKFIEDCYASGNVTGSKYVGGLIGIAFSGSMNRTLSIGKVTGKSNLGGLVGRNVSYGSAENCFWDTQTSGQSSSVMGIGKTTIQMKNISTFTNFNINYTSSNLNKGYPFLARQILNTLYTWVLTAISYVDILFPQDLIYSQNINQINYTYFDQVEKDKCWYSFDGGATNSTPVNAEINFTDVISSSGNNTITIFCNNTEGAVFNDTINFFINSLWFNNASAESSYRMSEFVKVNGTNFTLGGQRYRFLGADAYYLIDYATNRTFDDAGNEILGSKTSVTEVLNEAQYLNINVLRIWALMVGGNDTNPTHWQQEERGGRYNFFLINNTTNYNEDMYVAMDYVLAEMGKRDIRGQIVFVNNWDDYGGKRWWVQQSPTANWSLGDGTDAFNDQFYTDAWTINAFQQFINKTINRNNTITGVLYKDDPTILSWQLVNEARAKSFGKDRTKLANWTKNMTTFVKSIDSNHLVTLGIEGFGLVEDWGEGTDMITLHNNTGVDFATYELHPAQWDYIAQRSEGVTNGDWINGTIIAGMPEAVVNKTLLWWINGSGFSYNNRYTSGNVPAYTPALARHGYKNWIEQNVEWSTNILNMPVVIEELAVPNRGGILTDGQKKLFYDNAIRNFYMAGGDGLMMWNLNHDGYFYSTEGTDCYRLDTNTTGAGCMDDGYSFYVSDDPYLSSFSKEVIDAFNFTMYDNNGSSWVNLLDRYKYDFTINFDKMDDSSLVNCSINMNINNGTVRNVIISNSSEVIENQDYIFQYNFNQADSNVTWFSTCCSNISCYNSTSGFAEIFSSSPLITLEDYKNNTVLNTNNVNFSYSIHNYDLDMSYCQIYINGTLNKTDSTVLQNITEYFNVEFSNSSNVYNWYLKCSDIVGTISTSETRIIIIDLDNPNLTIISPENNSISGNSLINFLINVTDNFAIKNWTLSIFNYLGNLVSSFTSSFSYFNSEISVDNVSSLTSTPTYSTYSEIYTPYDYSYADTSTGGEFMNQEFYTEIYACAVISEVEYCSSPGYGYVADYSGSIFGINIAPYDNGGTIPTEYYWVNIYDASTSSQYYKQVYYGDYVYGYADFSTWNAGYFYPGASFPAYESSGSLNGEKTWRIWAKNLEDGEYVHSSSYAEVTDYDINYGNWQTYLSWDEVAEADSYIVFNTNDNFYIETSELNVIDDGLFNGWTYGTPDINQTSPFQYDKAGTVVSLISQAVSLSDGVYTWFVNVFDSGENNLVTSNQTLTVDTIKPAISFINPTLENGSYTNKDNLEVNISSSDTNDHFVVTNFDNSLVSWWRMDDANSTHVFDYMGRANGTIFNTNMTSVTNGKFGKAFNLLGLTTATDHVRFSATNYNYNYNYTQPFTISFWAKSNASQNTGVLGFINGGWGIVWRSANKYAMYLQNSTTAITDQGVANDSFSGEWVHIVMTNNGSGFYSLYTNNYLNKNVSFLLDNVGVNNNYFYIGAASFGGQSNGRYRGLIDEVMFFNRSLSLTEISSLYNATANKYYNNFTNLANGTHTVQSYAVDIAGNVNQTDLRTLGIDTINPLIEIISPTNATYFEDVLLLNISASDENLDSIWYTYNGTNYTYTSEINLTFNEGSNNLTAYANDSAGNINSTTTYFTLNLLPPVITIVSPTLENNPQLVSFIITTNKIASCQYKLDTEPIKNLITSNNLTHSDSMTLSGTHEVLFYCNDSYAKQSNLSRTFSIAVSTGGGGGSGSIPIPEELTNQTEQPVLPVSNQSLWEEIKGQGEDIVNKIVPGELNEKLPYWAWLLIISFITILFGFIIIWAIVRDKR